LDGMSLLLSLPLNFSFRTSVMCNFRTDSSPRSKRLVLGHSLTRRKPVSGHSNATRCVDKA
jgi:hypothetical protein